MGLNKALKGIAKPFKELDNLVSTFTKPIDKIVDTIHKPLKPINKLIDHIDGHVTKITHSVNDIVHPFEETARRFKGIGRKISDPIKNIKNHCKHSVKEIDTKIIHPIKSIKNEGRSISHAFKSHPSSPPQPNRQSYHSHFQSYPYHITSTPNFHTPPSSSRITKNHAPNNHHSNYHIHQFMSSAHHAYQNHKNNSNHHSLLKDLQKFRRR